MTDKRFEACLAAVLQHEGGYADHPADPGGATNMGITRKTLAAWRGIDPWLDLPKSEVRALTRAEAGRIYRANYWDRCRAGELPGGVDLALFDFAVNSGPDRAIRTLQTVLGIEADGILGPVTLAAIRKANARTLANALCDARLTFLRRLPTFPTFGRGWTSRVAAIRAVAVKAAANSSTTKGAKPMDVLSGYKTYIVAAFMLIAGVAQIVGVDLPALDGGAAGNLVLEALAILFLRRGLKADTAGA
jgi:lysozyme family protein